MLLLTLLLWVCIFGQSQQEEQLQGPFNIVFNQLEQCEETGTRQIYVSGMRVDKDSNNKTAFSANVTSNVAIDDNVMVEVDISNFLKGRWRPHFGQVELQNFCTSLNQTSTTYSNIVMRALNTECPIPAGTYEVRDLDMQSLTNGDPVPSAPYGKYKSETYWKANGSLIGCVRSYFDVVPAKKG